MQATELLLSTELSIFEPDMHILSTTFQRGLVAEFLRSKHDFPITMSDDEVIKEELEDRNVEYWINDEEFGAIPVCYDSDQHYFDHLYEQACLWSSAQPNFHS